MEYVVGGNVATPDLRPGDSAVTPSQVLDMIEYAHELICDESTEASLACRGVLAVLGKRVRAEGVTGRYEVAERAPVPPDASPAPWDGRASFSPDARMPAPGPIRYVDAHGDDRPHGRKNQPETPKRKALFT